MDTMPPEALLVGYPFGIQRTAETLRAIVRRAVPDAIERVRPGWRLIGYDVPVGRRTRYFAFVGLEPIHVHLGFEVGIFMADPERMLEGAHLGLRKVRYLTFEPDALVPEAPLLAFAADAARIAAIPSGLRRALLEGV